MKTTLWVLLFLCASALFAEVLFYDNFNRTNGVVGNSWTNIGPVSPIIENGSMKVISNSLQGVKRDFGSLSVTSGIYYVSYDWKITSNNWLADAFPNGTVTYLRHDYEGNLYYDNTSDFSNPITIGGLALNTWANFKLKVNIDTDRFSLWINNALVADNIAGLAVTDFSRFTFRAGSGASVTQYIDNFIVYNDVPPATPTNLTAIGAVNDITLNWTGTPQDFLTYKIYRKTTSPADVFLAEVPGTQTTYTDVTAAANTDYYYRVTAVSMNTIESGFSNEVTSHLQPVVSVSPQVIDITVGQGYTGETSFSISNNGNYPLEWNIQHTAHDPNNGLLAWYPLDGNAQDVSGNGRHGTVMGPTSTIDRFGNANSALHFSQNCVILPEIDFNLYTEFSLSLWVKYEGLYDEYFISYGCDDRGLVGFGYNGFSITTPTGGRLSTTYPAVNTWALYTLTYNNGTLNGYINGTLQASGSAVVNQYTSGNAGLATHWWWRGALLTSTRFTGSLDDVRIYQRELNANEVSGLYQQSSNRQTYLNIDPLSGSLGLNQSIPITIDIDATSLTSGSYLDTLYVQSNDTESPSVPVIVNLSVAPGDIVVAPSQFTIKLNAAANTNNSYFNIANTGLGRLDYSLRGSDNYNINLTLPSIPGYTGLGIYNEHMYYVSNSTSTWSNAKQACINWGGHLVTISNQAENDFISSNYAQLSWIGLNDKIQNNVWQWVTGEPYSYSNWEPSQPDNYNNDDCVQINWGHLGKWSDCEDNHAYNGQLITHILEFDYNSSSILTFSPNNGTIAPNESGQVSMAVNGSMLADGQYQTSVRIVSNAPEPRDTLYIPVTVKVDYTPPTPPIALTFDEVQSDMNQIYLSWTANALADSVYSYKVFRRGLHDTIWSLKGTVGAGHNWFIDDQFTGLDTTAVYYKITAIDWVDNVSTGSDEVMAWLQRFPAPTGLTMEIIRNRHVKLTWNPVTQTISGNPGTPSCYVIYRSNAPSPIEDFYFVGAVDATTFTHNWAAWFIEIGKQFYVVTAYSGSFEDLRAVAESRNEWKYGELERAAFDYLTNIKRTK